MPKGKRIPPCEQCHRDTPPLGETICRACQTINDELSKEEDAEKQFYNHIDDVQDPAVKQCLEALFQLVTKGRYT